MMSFNDCCHAIIVAAKDPKQVRQVDYAVGYARSGQWMSDAHEIKVQALYILNNISSWRGEVAKTVRASLKQIGGVK